MKKADRYTGIVILPGGKNQEGDRMTISENAAQQFENEFGPRGISAAEVKEAVRKWNALDDPKSLKEATLFERFRELQRKVFGDLG